MLRISSFLFATTVQHSFICQDLLFHNACLILTCLSIANHWSVYNSSIIKTLDIIAANSCFGLCGYTYITTVYNSDHLYLGFILPSTISFIWIYEHRCNNINLAYKLHLLLHILAVIAINIAIYIRCYESNHCCYITWK